MEILGLGVDLCEVARMERALDRHPTMRARVFTPEEVAYCDSKARPAESYAGRFAAREAVIKALGGYRGKRWQDISVTRAPSGAPAIRLTGNAKARADVLGIDRILITFTHEKTNAVAFAVAVSSLIPVLSPSEAASLDREAQARGISADALMEAAGREVADAAVRLAGGSYGRRAVVVCGKGNNGGDGLVAARYLDAWGVRTTVVLLEEGGDLREPAASNLRRLAPTQVRVRRFSDALLSRELERADVAMDAIFGTGFRGAPEDAHAEAIAALNTSGVPVVAVDIPSGVNGETGAALGEAVRADLTVTFGAAKPGILLFPGAAHAGVVEVEPIGFPRDLIRSDLLVVEAEDVAAWLPPREAETHKRSAGYAVVVAGSRSMTGAAALAGSAAYRAGAGLVAVAVPDSALPVVQEIVREAVFVPLPETAAGAAAGGSARLDEVLAQADALAVGPGMTTEERTSAWIRELVRSSEIPVVLDADGLNAFAGRAADLADRKADLILTPHAGEFARLADVPAREVEADRVRHVRELAAMTSATVLLKGSRTLVGTPDGVVRINPTGGPYLATGGTGDVLTGAIAGLLARGLAPPEAAAAAAFLHGLAGRLASLERGEGITAGDVLDHLPRAFGEVLQG